MSYCVGLQYYCKLGATNQAAHIYYVSRHIQHDLIQCPLTSVEGFPLTSMVINAPVCNVPCTRYMVYREYLDHVV
uniref:Uncharacterized protein n=1 Tax=Gopherus agassizii TaxID=38772 RepID=A0A452H780_9SAUR